MAGSLPPKGTMYGGDGGGAWNHFLNEGVGTPGGGVVPRSEAAELARALAEREEILEEVARERDDLLLDVEALREREGEVAKALNSADEEWERQTAENKAKINTLKADVEEEQRRRRALEEELVRSRREAESASAYAEKTAESEREERKQAVVKLHETERELEREAQRRVMATASFEAKEEKLKSVVEVLEKKCYDLEQQAKVATAETRESGLALEACKERIAQLEKREEDLVRENNQAKADLAEAARDAIYIAQMEKKLEGLQKILESQENNQKAEQREFKEKLKDANAKLKMATANVTQSEKEVSKCRKECDESSKALKAIKAAREADAKDAKLTLSRAMEKNAMASDRLASKLEKAEKESEKYKGMYNEVLTARKNSEKEAKAAAAELKKLGSQNAKLEAQIRKKEEEEEKRRKKLAEASMAGSGKAVKTKAPKMTPPIHTKPKAIITVPKSSKKVLSSIEERRKEGATTKGEERVAKLEKENLDELGAAEAVVAAVIQDTEARETRQNMRTRRKREGGSEAEMPSDVKSEPVKKKTRGGGDVAMSPSSGTATIGGGKAEDQARRASVQIDIRRSSRKRRQTISDIYTV